MARDFESGSSEFLEETSSAVVGTPVSLSAWVNVETLADMTAVSVADRSASIEFFELQVLSSGAIRFTTSGSASPESATTTATLSAGSWHHISGHATNNNIVRIVYLDGANKVADSTSESEPVNLDTFGLGVLSTSTRANHFDGLLAHVAIWNTGLSDDLHAALGAGASPLFIAPQNLVAYFPLIRDTVNIMTGVSASGTGTILTPDPGKIFMPSRSIIGSSSAGDVTVVLPGVGSTSSVGTLNVTGGSDLTLSGVSSPGQAGDLVISTPASGGVTVVLSGVSSPGQVGDFSFITGSNVVLSTAVAMTFTGTLNIIDGTPPTTGQLMLQTLVLSTLTLTPLSITTLTVS